jgi:hypothetical protein
MIKDKIKLLLEIYNNWTYKIPTDKEQLLFDFYAYSLINPSKLKDVNMKHSLEEGKKLIVNELIKEFKFNLLYSLSAELRHLLGKDELSFGKDTILHELKNDKTVPSYVYKLAEKYLEPFNSEMGIPDRKSSFKSIQNMKYSHTAMADFMSSIFLSDTWHYRLGDEWYGGKPWATIAQFWAKLYTINSFNDKIVLIDNIYDLQHNTDTVFNKIEEYSKDGYKWLGIALNFKRDIKDPFALYSKISPELRGPFAYAIKQLERKTLEHFSKNKTPSDLMVGDTIYIISDKDKIGELIKKWRIGRTGGITIPDAKSISGKGFKIKDNKQTDGFVISIGYVDVLIPYTIIDWSRT